MITFFLVLAGLAAAAATGTDALQSHTDLELLPRPFLFMVMAAAYVLTCLAALVWMFTVDIPRPLAFLVGGVAIGALAALWVKKKMMDELPQMADIERVRRAPSGPAGDRPAPDVPGKGADEEPDEPVGGWGTEPDDPDEREAPAFIVGDDPHPTEKPRRGSKS